MSELKSKKAQHSRTLWLAAATAAAGAVLSVAPQAIPVAATGPGLLVLAALNAVLRVVTTQPIGKGE